MELLIIHLTDIHIETTIIATIKSARIQYWTS